MPRRYKFLNIDACKYGTKGVAFALQGVRETSNELPEEPLHVPCCRYITVIELRFHIPGAEPRKHMIIWFLRVLHENLQKAWKFYVLAQNS